MKRMSLLLVLVTLLMTTAIQAQEEPVTLQFWTRLGDNAQVTQVVEEWNAANPNIQVELQGIPGDDYRTRLLAAVAGGTAPDIVGMDTPIMAQYMSLGAVRPIDEYITPELREDFPDGLWFSATGEDGQTYAVPWWSDPSAMHYNAKLLEAIGMNPPETWDDLRAIAAAVTINTGNPDTDVYGAILPAVGPWIVWVWTPYLWAAGGDLVDENDCAAFNNEAGREAMQLWVDIFQAGQMPRSAVFGDSATIQTLFFNDRVGLMVMGPSLYADAVRVNPDIQMGSVPAPRPADREHSAYLGGDNLVIMSASEHPDEAWQFIEYMIDANRMRELSIADNGRYIGGMMTRSSAFSEDYLEANPHISGFVEALQYGRVPTTRFLNEIRNPIWSNFQAALDGQLTVEEALSEAERGVNDVTGCF